MHILIIPSELYCPDFSPMEGIFQRDQAYALVNEGLKVGILSIGYLPFKQIVKRNEFRKLQICTEGGVNIIRNFTKKFLPYWLISINRKKNFHATKGLQVFKEYVKLFGLPDIIHAHNCFFAGIVAKTISEKYNIAYVITEHSSKFFSKLKIKEVCILNEIHEKCKIHAAVSNSFCRIVQGLISTSQKNLICIPNIVDSIFETSNLNFNDKKEFIFLSIGGLIKLKNQELLLYAFAKYFKNNDLIKLRIAGDGPEMRSLNKLAFKLKINNQVQFLGYINRNDVLNEIMNCNAFVLSSNFETFGVVLIEAIACGKPIISTACIGPNDIVTSVNGILVPVGNSDKLGEAMKYVADNYDKFDPVAIKEECIKKYGHKAIVQKLINIYNQVLLK